MLEIPPQNFKNDHLASSGTWGAAEARTDPGATSSAARACACGLTDPVWPTKGTTCKQAAEAGPRGLHFASWALRFGSPPSLTTEGGIPAGAVPGGLVCISHRAGRNVSPHGLVDL